MTTDLHNKASLVRLVILDVDGILTDGTIYYHDDGSQLRAFNIQDGLGIGLLQRAQIPVAIISGKQSRAVTHRLREMNITDIYQGQEKKIPAYLALQEKYQLNDNEIAFMGDDLIDLPLLRRVGFAVSVPDATSVVQNEADWATQKKGGFGAVRELADFILTAKGLYQAMVQSFFNHD